MFGIFENARTEAEAQQIVETRWRNARLMLNGDQVTRGQEVLFKLLLGEVVEEQLRSQRQTRMLLYLVLGLGGETVIYQAIRLLS